MVDLADKTLRRLAAIAPLSIPVSKIARAMALCDDEGRAALRSSIARRRPRDDRERQALLSLALSTGAGGVAFVDFLGGFDGQRPN